MQSSPYPTSALISEFHFIGRDGEDEYDIEDSFEELEEDQQDNTGGNSTGKEKEIFGNREEVDEEDSEDFEELANWETEFWQFEEKIEEALKTAHQRAMKRAEADAEVEIDKELEKWRPKFFEWEQSMAKGLLKARLKKSDRVEGNEGEEGEDEEEKKEEDSQESADRVSRMTRWIQSFRKWEASLLPKTEEEKYLEADPLINDNGGGEQKSTSETQNKGGHSESEEDEELIDPKSPQGIARLKQNFRRWEESIARAFGLNNKSSDEAREKISADKTFRRPLRDAESEAGHLEGEETKHTTTITEEEDREENETNSTEGEEAKDKHIELKEREEESKDTDPTAPESEDQYTDNTTTTTLSTTLQINGTKTEEKPFGEGTHTTTTTTTTTTTETKQTDEVSEFSLFPEKTKSEGEDNEGSYLSL